MGGWKKMGWAAVGVFVLAMAIHQWLSYERLRSHIGLYAYATGYALRFPGKEGEYVGQVADVRWNALADREEDIAGFQPRYLIARETVPGVTETKWYCTYLFKLSLERPANCQPSPFPPYRNELPNRQ